MSITQGSPSFPSSHFSYLSHNIIRIFLSSTRAARCFRREWGNIKPSLVSKKISLDQSRESDELSPIIKIAKQHSHFRTLYVISWKKLGYGNLRSEEKQPKKKNSKWKRVEIAFRICTKLFCGILLLARPFTIVDRFWYNDVAENWLRNVANGPTLTLLLLEGF